MKDRWIYGVIAGIAGVAPQFIFSQTLFWGFHLQKLQFYDFAGILAFNHKPQGLWEFLYAEAIVVGQMAVYGILFAFLIQVIANPNLLLKGGIFGGFCWFATYVLADLYKTQGVHKVVDFNTALANVVASVIWGIAMAGVFLWIKRRYGPTQRTKEKKGK